MVPRMGTSSEEWAVEWDTQGISRPLRSHPLRIPVSRADHKPSMGEAVDRSPVHVTTPALVDRCGAVAVLVCHHPWQGGK